MASAYAVPLNLSLLLLSLSPSLLQQTNFVKGEEKQPERKVMAGTSGLVADVVVATDGSGNYRSITDAVNRAPNNVVSGRYVIYIKAGTYMENILVGPRKKNLAFVGDGRDRTILTTNRSPPAYDILTSPALVVRGEGFFARDMKFENTAGPSGGQAVSMRSDGDFSAFYRCTFSGYQDTLFSNINRQFYKECDISGTVDFIFGHASAVFQDCNIYARLPLPGGEDVVVAQGKEAANPPGGFVLQNCWISPSEKLGSARSYLGRPWKPYSTAVIMESTNIDGFIDPAAFLEFTGEVGNGETATLWEYANKGSGSDTRNRVKWSGYKVINDAAEAEQYTVAKFINGNEWLPALGIPFKAGL